MGLAGPSGSQSLADWVREVNTPDSFGGVSTSPMLMELLQANYGGNLLVGGSFESWSAGITSVPDGYVLTGAGASVARNTTSFTHGLAAVDLTAALNTATDLAQSLTVSATVNARLRGKPVTALVRVKVATANRVFLRIDDGVGTTDSPLSPGFNDFTERLIVHRILDPLATKLEVSCEITAGAALTATFDALMLVEGAGEVEFSPNPVDRLLQPRIVSPDLSGLPSTTSNVYVVIGTGAQQLRFENVIVDGTISVRILGMVLVRNNTLATTVTVGVFRDDNPLTAAEGQVITETTNTLQGLTLAVADIKPAAGNYTYQLKWKTSGGTAVMEAGRLAVQPEPTA